MAFPISSLKCSRPRRGVGPTRTEPSECLCVDSISCSAHFDARDVPTTYDAIIDCSICLCEVANGDIWVLSCGHVFCKTCVCHMVSVAAAAHRSRCNIKFVTCAYCKAKSNFAVDITEQTHSNVMSSVTGLAALKNELDKVIGVQYKQRSVLQALSNTPQFTDPHYIKWRQLRDNNPFLTYEHCSIRTTRRGIFGLRVPNEDQQQQQRERQEQSFACSVVPVHRFIETKDIVNPGVLTVRDKLRFLKDLSAESRSIHLSHAEKRAVRWTTLINDGNEDVKKGDEYFVFAVASRGVFYGFIVATDPESVRHITPPGSVLRSNVTVIIRLYTKLKRMRVSSLSLYGNGEW